MVGTAPMDGIEDLEICEGAADINGQAQLRSAASEAPVSDRGAGRPGQGKRLACCCAERVRQTAKADRFR
jgi:hypothetical protein